MNLSTLPGALEKRDVLYGVKNASNDELVNLGKQFEAATHYSDALDFFGRAQAMSEIQRVENIALNEGDFFLYSRCLKIQGRADDSGAWEALGDKALSLQKFRFALRAFERGGLRDKESALRAQLADQADIQSEEASRVFIPATPADSPV